jgi:hypothetical protein
MSMILGGDEDQGSDAYFVDHSTLFGAFSNCKEKGRLTSVMGLRPKAGVPALSFGHAIHAGVAALGSGYDLNTAHTAYLNDLKTQNAALPISIMDEERRTVERGLSLLSAYHERWANDVYDTVISPSGVPYVEIKFRLYLFTWHDGRPVFFCGIIDRIAKSRLSGYTVIIETKTTTQGLSQFIKQTRPNHQVSGYHKAAIELINVPLIETVYDCIFVSDRKPSQKPNVEHWLYQGIDIEKDFARTTTRRSERDMAEYEFDLIQTARDYLTYRESGLERWPRNAPGACHMMGGCYFRDLCGTNLDENILNSQFKVQRWEPWKSNISSST